MKQKAWFDHKQYLSNQSFVFVFCNIAKKLFRNLSTTLLKNFTTHRAGSKITPEAVSNLHNSLSNPNYGLQAVSGNTVAKVKLLIL